jgi:putative nucleotidyltransferase with HDIG domain
MISPQYHQFLTQLVSATKAVHLYPPEHPARVQPLRRIHQILEEVLKRFPAFFFGVEEGILVIQGEGIVEELPVVRECLDRLSERKIKRVEWTRGAKEKDVEVVIELLSLDPKALSAFTHPQEFVKKRGASFTRVEEEEEDLEKRALRVYTEAKSYIVQLWNEARLGRLPEGDRARTLVEELAQIVGRDRNALLGLTMLSDYDNYTFNHSVNVGVFALTLAEELGLSHKKIIGLGGLMHDIGKTRLPLEVINKPGRLSREEWELMKLHPVYGAEMVEGMNLREIREIVYEHHCGWNRKGYPFLPTQKDVSEEALIVSVCDVYDSVTTLRPYQRQHTPQEGIEILLKLKANGHLKGEYVDAFIRLLGIYPVGTTVRLNTGEIGIVVGVHREAQDRPKLKLVRDRRGNFLRIPVDLDLLHEREGRRIVGTLDPASLGIYVSDYLENALGTVPASP